MVMVMGEVIKKTRKETQEPAIQQHIDFEYKCLNRIGETGLVPVSSFHTTVRTVRYTAVP